MMQFDGPGMPLTPQQMGIDPEHLRMMIEEGMGHGDGNVIRMRAPELAPVRAPLLRLRAPLAPVRSTLIRI
jgi:hypothetical protein